MPRYNKSRNPTCANNVTDYLQGANGTLSRFTGDSVSTTGRSTGAQLAGIPTSAFTTYLNGGTAAGSSTNGGQTWSYVAWVKCSVARTINHGLFRFNNTTPVGSIFANTSGIALTANTWTKIRGTGTIPTGSTWNQFGVHIDIANTGSTGTLKLACVRIEQVNDTTMEFADGSSGGAWGWDGTSGNSTSTEVDAFAPTVNAGADAVVNQFSVFNRTAVDTSDGGAAITSRQWKVQTGPTYVNNILSTTTVLAWEPETPGSYTLRYSATNSVGTGTDDLSITVDTTPHTRLGTIRLFGTSTTVAHKINDFLIDIPIKLHGTYTAFKAVPTTRTANIILDGSALGQRINLGSGNIRLHGVLSAYSRPGAGAATARMRLASSATGIHQTSVTRTKTIRLQGTRQGFKTGVGSFSGNLSLESLHSAFKDVPQERTVNIRLIGTRSGGIHETPVAVLKNLRLLASLSNRSRVTPNVPHSFNIRLAGTPTATSRRTPAFRLGQFILIGTVFGIRVESELARAVVTRADNTTKYELVCVARIPQTLGPPVFLEVDPIDWTGLTLNEELSQPSKLSASVKVNSLTDTVLQRIRKPSELATELWLYRNGQQVFAGPLLGVNAQGRDNVSLEAGDLMTYLSMMGIVEDLAWPENTDQFTIVKGLIDKWQGYEFGNFGIDTSGITPSGINRGVTYLFKELTKLDKAIDDLRKMDQGFDIDIDPSNRRLRLYHPFKGVDRSEGPDAIVFDASNISSTNLTWSASPTDLASDGYGTATGENDTTLSSHRENVDLRTRYGRTVFMQNYDKAGSQENLDSYTQAGIDVRKDILLIPGPDARVTPDSDIASYGVGDTVNYTLHERLTTAGAFRLRKRTINISTTGQESVSPEFV